MSRTAGDTQSVVAAIRAETRARLAAIRLEREAYRAAQQEKWRAARLPVADAVAQPAEPFEDQPADPDPDRLARDAACPPEAASEQANGGVAEVEAADEDACAAPPEPAAAPLDPIPSSADGEATGADDTVAADPPYKEPASTKLRITAAVTAATSMISIPLPPEPPTVAEMAEEAPQSPADESYSDGALGLVPALDDEAEALSPATPPLPETRTPLSALTWLGPGLLRRLSSAGIHHVEELAARDADTLATDLGSVGRLVNVATLISEARASCAG